MTGDRLDLLDGDFPNLLAARERTAIGLRRYAATLERTPLPDDVAVVLFGSWGRSEVTPGSDNDWAFLGRSVQPDAEVPSGEALPGLAPPPLAVVGAVLGGEGRDPGATGIFGTTIAADRLVAAIGLDADDNRNLTRRMLLVLESVAVVGEELHREVLEQVVEAYLASARRDFRPPRFFLNDVIRYWRTICVDFEAKQRGQGDRKWGMRNAKLRTSRKVLFAGGLLPLLDCHLLPAAEHRAHLLAELSRPPTDRIAGAFARYGARDAGRRCLGAYDRWIGLLTDDEARAELTSLTADGARDSAVFRDARRCGLELQAGLLALLYETPLRDVAREYAVF
jgi:hypothetical protein